MKKEITISVKNIIIFFLLVSIVVSFFYFSPVSDAGVSTFNITNQVKTISVGESFQIKLNGLKANSVKWKSSNKSIASVNKNGIVKGLKCGKTVIKGKYKGLSFNITVTVKQTYKKQTLYNDKYVRLSFLKMENKKVYFEIENKTNEVIGASLECIEYDGNYVDFSTWVGENRNRISAKSSAICYFEYKGETIKSVYMELYIFSTKADDTSIDERQAIRLNFE